MNQYEIAILYDPGLEVDFQSASNRVEKIFQDNGGKVVKTDDWGKRKLAYPINKQETALYVFYTVDLPAENVRKVESILNITDEVIRFLIVKPDLKKIAKAEAAKADKAAKAAKRGEETEEDSAKDEEE